MESPKGTKPPISDVTWSALKEARESLRASEEHFRLLVDSVRDYAIFLLDPSGHVASWNLGAERIKGYSAAEIIGSHFSRFYPEEDIRNGKCEMELEVATREGRFEEEGWRIKKNGETFWANVVITAVRDKTGELVGFAKVTRDLTERRQALEERLRLESEQKAREAADAANRAKDEFLAHVSHELRTPLNAILGWARLLGTGLDEARSKRATDTIERNAEAMTRLIDDLLDISRIVSGKMRLDVEPVDLPLLIERALESVRLGADARNIRVHTVIAPEPSPVLGDAGRLQQVIWNLLSNAVKFTPNDGQISVFLHRTGASSVELVVSDTGRGIAKDKIPAMFHPFWQETSGPSAGGKGLGLGLAISKNIVELHGGHIHAESKGLGQGTVMTVHLPLGEPRPAVSRDRPSETPSTPPPPSSLPQLLGLRVLLVEDEEDARELMKSALERAGCVVATADGVAEGFAAFEHEVPDVLVSDIGLRGESGYDLMRKIRALPPERGGNVPAAAVTAYARSEDRMRALAAGFIAHIPKPLEPSELVMVIAALTSQVRTGRATA